MKCHLNMSLIMPIDSGKSCHSGMPSKILCIIIRKFALNIIDGENVQNQFLSEHMSTLAIK